MREIYEFMNDASGALSKTYRPEVMQLWVLIAMFFLSVAISIFIHIKEAKTK